MKLDEKRVQLYLSEYLRRKGHGFTIPNISWSWLYWEADLVSITKNFYLYEYEIKITRPDFQNDFKKRKHNQLKAPHAGNRIPNYFTYVAPLEAIPLCIPDYAGLYEIQRSGRYGCYIDIIEIKRPALLHREKQTRTSIIKMLKTMMAKYWDLAETLENNKVQSSLILPEGE